MYSNGADDDLVEKMALFLDSTRLLCRGRSFPCALSKLLLSYIFSSACLEIKSDSTLA